MTRQPINTNMLIPNIALKQLIEQYVIDTNKKTNKNINNLDAIDPDSLELINKLLEEDNNIKNTNKNMNNNVKNNSDLQDLINKLLDEDEYGILDDILLDEYGMLDDILLDEDEGNTNFILRVEQITNLFGDLNKLPKK